MLRIGAVLFLVLTFFPGTHTTNLSSVLHEKRQSSSDLELGGDLAGVEKGTTRYIAREDLLALPQVTYTVADDTNFSGPTEISGVLLETLAMRLGATPKTEMVVAICDDRYQANYPRGYLSVHHPVLVLNVNGKPPSGWPKDSEDHKYDMGPYMVSHANFKPAFKILSHEDEPQIPWGVVRLEIRNEKEVLGAIAPPVSGEAAIVRAGYRIARQNCFKCHNMGHEGGQKSGRSWQSLTALASKSPEYFGAYVRDPKSKRSDAQMPGNPEYDAATIKALTIYFQTFPQAAQR